MLETALGVIAYLVTLVALVAIAIRSLDLYRRIKVGQPDPTRSNNKVQRLRLMIREVLTHAKMLNFTGSGIAHWFVMIGFVSLFGTLVTAYGQIFDPHFVLPI
ncbi:MAG: Fe-S oxidoreductase, partial [Actinomycetota bacterium]